MGGKKAEAKGSVPVTDSGKSPTRPVADTQSSKPESDPKPNGQKKEKGDSSGGFLRGLVLGLVLGAAAVSALAAQGVLPIQGSLDSAELGRLRQLLDEERQSMKKFVSAAQDAAGEQQKEVLQARQEMTAAVAREQKLASERTDLRLKLEAMLADSMEVKGSASAEGAATWSTCLEGSPARAALAVLRSKRLEACDEGLVNGGCPDPHTALRTWQYGIDNLWEAIKDNADLVTTLGSRDSGYIAQIWGDTDSLLTVSTDDDIFAKTYVALVYNNRQVFMVARGYLTAMAAEALEPLARLNVLAEDRPLDMR
eukprot:TRINITY_DN32375_c0_g1_i1.p1 TRINITY_DN32375_c0_g1~~TRINITY_DN32375_c0_g1_i1.p1  ORF type:complete len:311 (-),score=72.63 TRINITY_DN32375_c0_g1_i1:1-933(-)